MCSFFRRDRETDASVTRHEARRRLSRRLGGTHIEDYVFGANDGIITTFAIVAGATGGALGSATVIILGFANLFADGISMGAGNYLGKKSLNDYIRSEREMEEWEVEHIPEQEKDELREIFTNIGLKDDLLDAVVAQVARDKSVWVDLMMAGELRLIQSVGSPVNHGLATFVAFVTAGFAPLFPYLFCSGGNCFLLSAVLAGTALFATGALRTLITGVNWVRSGLEMLGIGSAAALAAYGIGRFIAGLT